MFWVHRRFVSGATGVLVPFTLCAVKRNPTVILNDCYRLFNAFAQWTVAFYVHCSHSFCRSNGARLECASKCNRFKNSGIAMGFNSPPPLRTFVIYIVSRINLTNSVVAGGEGCSIPSPRPVFIYTY